MSIRQHVLAFIVTLFAMSSFGSDDSNTIILRKKLYQKKSVDFYLLKSKKYTDMRLDLNHDGQIDFWQIEDGSVYIEQKIKNGVTQELYIKGRKKSKIQEMIFVKENNKLKIKFAANKNGNIYFQDLKNCSEKNLDIPSQKKIFSKIEESVAEDNIKKLIDPSCKQSMPEKVYQAFEKVIIKANEYDADEYNGQISDISNNNISCLADSMGEYKLRDVDVSKTKSAQYADLVYKNVSGSSDLKIKCLKAGGAFSKSFYDEQKKEITFVINPDLKDQDFPETYLHEILHYLGGKDELEVSQLTNKCFDHSPSSTSKSTLEVRAVLNNNLEQSIAAADRFTGNQSSEVPKEFAEAPASIQPSPQTLAQVEAPFKEAPSVNTTTDSYKAQALAVSEKATSGLLDFASKATDAVAAMSITPAQANTLASSVGNGTSAASSRVPASATTSRQSSTTKTSLSSSNGLAPDERVVEQVEINDNQKIATAASLTQASSGSPSSDLKTKSSEVSKNLNANQDRAKTSAQTNAASSRELASGSVGGTGFSGNNSAELGSATSSIPIAKASATNQASGAQANNALTGSQTRSPSSTSAPSVSPQANKIDNKAAAPMISYISETKYQDMRKKLTDSQFLLKLQRSSIRLITKEGDILGDKKGQIIFRDNGTKFIREK